ncbi:MAG: AHH domain-containing protein [Planctomycetales bacterium]|nr:AHH domain-containing protein [Planctomycetales bacterium]
MAGHSAGTLVNKFCTQRTAKCDPCGNKYADVVKNNTSLAVSFKFPRLKKKENIEISQNAHHLLCVAEITKVISKDPKLKTVLENTEYCVNNPKNMMALPLFAHTVYWYCLAEDIPISARAVVGSITTTYTPPPFANLPNHDFDHGKYNKEVEEALEVLKAEVKEADHSIAPAQLSASLDEMSGDMEGLLKIRGKRKGGTHLAWLDACEEKVDNWFLPYSLAHKPEERGFPKRLNKNLSRLKAAIKNLIGG